MLEEATEGFQLQLVQEDEETATRRSSIDRLTADHRPIIKLVDSTLFNALAAPRVRHPHRDPATTRSSSSTGSTASCSRRCSRSPSSTTSTIISAHQGDVRARHRREARAAGRPLQAARRRASTIDFRVSIMPTRPRRGRRHPHPRQGVDRASSSAELRLDILGFPEDGAAAASASFIREPYGMVLVTGPDRLAARRRRSTPRSPRSSRAEDKIITIEDPVEYQLKGITQIPVNEKKGLTFARGLRSILRHDPDKIMVGEIRDPETAQIAIQSALTGHLVFTTVHANNVVDVLGRFLNMGVEPYQLRLGAQLRAGAAPGARDLRALQDARCRSRGDCSRSRASTRRRCSDQAFYEGAGCIECGGTGYKGRTAICELLDLSDRDPGDDPRPAARRRRSSSAAREEGMRFLRESRGRTASCRA
ncbi:MAG: Flp pilus assembly complex ATPase component TadA [Desulfobacterales bacterium]|nr:Flp pilus assembly complex ATPase component TadA [Desulfobacterales bacterium]